MPARANGPGRNPSSYQGLKARSNRMHFNDHQPLDRAYSPQGIRGLETQPGGLGWYNAGPLALKVESYLIILPMIEPNTLNLTRMPKGARGIH